MIENVEVDSRQREVEVGDVFFTTSSETPEEVGMSSVLKKKIGITYLNSFCFGFRPSVKFDLDYLAFMLRSESVRKQIKLLAQGISRFNIAKTKMMYIDIQVPKIDEQIAIGKYFAQLDRLITLHQCNCNMATRPCEWSSGLRAIAWEQRKLGEIAEKTFGGGTPSTSNPDFWSGKIPWIQSSDLTEDNLFDVKPRKFISKLAIKSSASKIIPKNSIAIIVRVGVGKLALLPFQYSTSQDFLSIAGLNIDGLFASYSIYKKLKKDLPLVQGTSIKGITKEELLGKVLLIPIKKSEQARIGTFFRQLDRLVTLHQRKHILLT